MSKALSSKTIVIWAVGLAVIAVVAVSLLWAFLGGGDPATARKLDAIRTASSLVIGAGGAAALLLAARRQRYVELDLEQKEHDADERRVTELYGKAADQLGSDKAPVRLAGVYALERLAQDHPQHRQTIVNLLCAYLRMPFDIPKETDKEGIQERLVRSTVQGVLEAHLQPSSVDRFWPDIDLVLTSATLDYFWLRHCRVRHATFRYATFHAIAAFRDSVFTRGSDFQKAHFTGTADLRRTDFGPGTTTFREATFDGNTDFGDEPTGPTAPNGSTENTGSTEPRKLDLTGATATADGTHHWPEGWRTEPVPAPAPESTPDRLTLVRD